MLKVVEIAQDEQSNRRKVDKVVRGTCVVISTKKKKLVETQYHASEMVTVWNQTMKSRKEMEESYEAQFKELRDKLKDCKKQLKKEQGHAERLEVSLSQRQCDLEKVFEEIRELKGQAHQSQEVINQLSKETSQWK